MSSVAKVRTRLSIAEKYFGGRKIENCHKVQCFLFVSCTLNCTVALVSWRLLHSEQFLYI